MQLISKRRTLSMAAASPHSHTISEVGGLQTALDDLTTALDGKAEAVHTHAISDVTGLQTELDLKLEAADLASYALTTALDLKQDITSDLTAYLANALTATELQQLQNINSVALSNTKWSYLGAATSFGGPLLASADLAAFVTALGGATAVRSAISTYSTTQIDAAIAAAIAALVDSSPGTLDTLNELAAALGDDPNFATTIASSIAAKQDITTNLTYWNGYASIGAVLDAIGSTRGSILYRGAGGWAILAPGEAGKVFKSNGAGADPSWQDDSTATGIADGSYGDITISSSGTVFTVANNAISLAKMATMATASFLGRNTALTGNVEVLSVSTVRTMLSISNVENKSSSTIRGEITSGNVTTALGYTPQDAAGYTAADVLTKIKTVDGTTSGLDADLLDGQEGSYYLNAGNFNAGTILAARMPAHTGDVTSTAGSISLTLAASTVLTKLLTVDGTASGLDADMVDGYEASALLNSSNQSSGTLPAARMPALTGDVTTSAGAVATTIAAAAISGKTAITDVDEAADYLLIWDATDSALKKTLAKYIGVGKDSFFIPAAAWKPRGSNGCAALATTETGTNKINIESLDFDGTSIEYAQLPIYMLKRWGTTTFTYRVVWTHGSTVTNFGVRWNLRGAGWSDGESLDAALGTAVAVDDTGGNTSYAYITAESTAVTLSSLSALDFGYVELYRDPTHANDTMTVDAKFVGIIMTATSTQNTDD